MERTWASFLDDETLFDNAIRLRHLVWTIQQVAAPGARLLEVGFGSGTTAILLADLGYRVTAFDLDPRLIDRLRRRYPFPSGRGRLELCRADMRALPWTGRPFEVAYHQGVLEHFPDDGIVDALSAQSRVAHRVVFDVPNANRSDRPFGDERLLPPAHWRDLVHRAGLTIERELGYAFPHWTYGLPHALFSRRGVRDLAGFGRRLGRNSIFVCKS